MTIQILPARLANQIAAGEVVERPASVVKELVENSLDAGATRIEIDIEKGGSKLIRVHDNGVGIDKTELGLALSRHATSKIASLDDLEAILSLGFRGEALASISSVSRLTLTSRTQNQSQAWSAYAEGREMQVQIKPAAHPVGSTVEVLDLFFNTPARRKFLRTDKTEFTHIDELIKRIALSRFDVTIILRHNGNVVRQYRPATNNAQKLRRLAAICGNNFAKDAVEISLEHQELLLSGWICTPKSARAQNDLQYCFVNQRMMKDKLINHAIRQGYESTLNPEQFAAFVLYIKIDPKQVDVNVHPAKHEVRFHQARLVHDFIYQAVSDALSQIAQDEQNRDTENNQSAFADNQVHEPEPEFASVATAQSNSAELKPSHSATNHNSDSKQRSSAAFANNNAPVWQPSLKANTNINANTQQLYQKLLQASATPENIVTKSANQITKTVLTSHESPSGLGKPLAIVNAQFLLLQQSDKIQLVDLSFASYLAILGKLKLGLKQGLTAQPLLIPQRLNVTEQEMQILRQHQPLLQEFGIIFNEINRSQILIMAVCQLLRERNLQQFFNHLFAFMTSCVQVSVISAGNMSTWLASELMVQSGNFSLSQAVGLLAELENYWQGELVAHFPKLLRLVDVTAVIDSFNDD